MAQQRQYWVVSPNVDGSGKFVEQWKNEILKYHVAIMGWAPDHRVVGNTMGPQFAGKGNPSVQQGDIVLIARSHRNSSEVVAVGVVNSEWWGERLQPHPNNDEVYLRHLEPFKPLYRVPQDIPIKNVLPHIKTMRGPLSPEDPAHKIVCEWMERQLLMYDRKVGNDHKGHGAPRQPDIQRRHAVEMAAQEAVGKLYSDKGYSVIDVSDKKRGWDLEATRNRGTIKIEVKGLFGDTSLAELTPNEYRPIKGGDRSYRLCIVTNALNPKPRIQDFYFDSESQCWADQEGNRLSIEVREGARVRSD